MPETKRRQIILGVTGASGAVYAQRLLDLLDGGGVDVHLVVSPRGRRLLADELSIKSFSPEAVLGRASERVTRYRYCDIGARIASGSFIHDGMIICPCSTHSMAAVASGLGDNLIFRAAAVTLKERRRLVLVPREMPLTSIDLRNALRLSEAGAVICPASPGFYMHPRGVGELVDFVVGKVLDLFDVPHELNTRWTGGVSGLAKGEGTPRP